MYQPTISMDAARHLVSRGAQLVDVRNPGEHERGALPGSVNIPLPLIQQAMKQGNYAETVRLCDQLLAKEPENANALLTKARAADAPSLGSRTVREWYAAFYGPEAEETDRTETLGLAALRLEEADDSRKLSSLKLGLRRK